MSTDRILLSAFRVVDHLMGKIMLPSLDCYLWESTNQIS